MEWPKNNKYANFEDICKPVIKAIKDIYSLKRKHKRGIKWTGLPIGRKEAATCLENDEALTADSLKYDAERGRSPLDVIIGVAVRLGIEQGRRMANEDLQFWKSEADFWKRRWLHN